MGKKSGKKIESVCVCYESDERERGKTRERRDHLHVLIQGELVVKNLNLGSIITITIVLSQGNSSILESLWLDSL